MAKQSIPGLGITVLHHGKKIYSKGFGWAHVDRRVPVSPEETLFRIASISKTMTAALMARLEWRGIIAADSSALYYAPWFPEKRWDFSVKQLAGHMAGIRTYKGDEFYSNVHYTSVGSSTAVFTQDTLVHEPGSRYLYSTYGWTLLSAIVEGATKIPYLDLMRDSVFDLMSLEHTYPNDNYIVARDKVRSGYYKATDDTFHTEVAVDLSNKWAGGGFESTCEDVARFGWMFWFGNYVPDTWVKIYTQPQLLADGQSTNYGMGWISGKTHQGQSWYGHAGGAVGGKSILVVVPEEELVVAITTNCTNANLKALYLDVVDHFTE